MLQEVAKDYAEYLKLDLTSGFQTIQDVIDNMITRLEELTSVLQMIKLKNSDCSNAVTEDISRYRHEVTILSKKIITLSDVVFKLQTNVEVLEKRVEKAEADFGVQVDNKLKNLLKPFLKKKDANPGIIPQIIPPDTTTFSSVLDNFEGSNTNT
ncbi:uncharacterized protein LOC123876753 [Maniola jurtina]|uniref:uncharacterized protein LOC123876753 n=1 Tax=Maniola jurtina TaxID=191418 RepID=UPI001E68BE82|nr:uncharacterized protein LOC123876753 [Maniola jurtina]